MRKHFPGQPRSRLNSTEIPPSRGNIFPYEHIFLARRGNLFCLWLILWRQRQSAIVLYPGLLGKLFFHMKGQGILPRLSDFPGETGKCRGKFLHMNRPYCRYIRNQQQKVALFRLWPLK